ncbi:MAG: SPOR domain-containing protein [Fibromonadales bacterium]|nr:SPOR domain-containing protein [Fibromonadales bacterium]
MAKIAKHIAAATFFMSFLVFANSEVPTDLDSLFRGKEFQLPPLDSSHRTSYSEVPLPKSTGKESNEAYVLQFDAIVNFDAAQARRATLRTQTGYEIQMIFDAPFYKLRGGNFRKKSEAEDKARELSLYNISAFVIRIR